MSETIDGRFDAGDDTGHARIDATLDAFADANRGNPAAIAVLERLAAHVKTHPEEFLEDDGTLKRAALAAALERELAAVGSVVVPAEPGDPPAPLPAPSSSAGATTVAGLVAAAPVGRGVFGALADGDIMSIAFIVMMEAAKSAREDLHAIMEGVKAINREKEGWRAVSTTLRCLGAAELPRGASASLRCQPFGAAVLDGDRVLIKAPGPRGSRAFDAFAFAAADPATARETVKDKLDSLSEMGEMESLRLQMAMDRLSKLMSTISNLLKKTSDTASALIANLK